MKISMGLAVVAWSFIAVAKQDDIGRAFML
jgi:hypothetical protein